MKKKKQTTHVLLALICSVLMCAVITVEYIYAAVILPAGSLGIDVSKHQGSINWNLVKQTDIKFAIIRLGYGNNQYDQDDQLAEYNMSECDRLGIPYGVYLYSYAVSEAEAYSEAAHIIRMLNGRKPVLGVYLDVEDTNYYAQNGLDVYTESGRRRLTDYTKIVLNEMTKAGYKPGYYASVNYNENILYKNELDGYRWIAGWGDYEDYARENNALIWQYSNNGSIAGIEGRVDLDKLLKDVNADGSTGNKDDEEKPDTGGEYEGERKYGDVNGDNRINSLDVVGILNYCVGINEESYDYKYADFNKDGSVNSMDAVELLRYIVGING